MTEFNVGDLEFKVGDWVRWISQAQGVELEKVGQIVAIIPPNVPYWKWHQSSGFDDTKFILRTDLGSTMRKETSYLVAVPPEKGRRGKSRLYWPRAWAIEHC